MRIAYFDCPMGASGDMILGALLDAGLDGEQLAGALAGLNLPGYTLRWARVKKGPLAATQVTVETSDTSAPPARAPATHLNSPARPFWTFPATIPRPTPCPGTPRPHPRRHATIPPATTSPCRLHASCRR